MYTQNEQLLAVDYKDLVMEVFQEVLLSPCGREEAIINQHFDEEYIQYWDGKFLGFKGPEGFRKHIQTYKVLRTITAVEFDTLVQEGDTVFTSHYVTSTDNANLEQPPRKVKVMAEVRFNQRGKVCFCDEVTAALIQ